MAITIEVEPGGALARVTVSDAPTADEFLEARQRYRADAALLACRRFLVDLRGASSSAVSVIDVRYLAATRAELPLAGAGTRTAVVAAGPHVTALARMYAATRQGAGELAVFSDADEALRWLEHGEAADEAPAADP